MADTASAAPMAPGRHCISLSGALCTRGVKSAPVKPGMISRSICNRPASVGERRPSLVDEVPEAGFQPYHARMVPKLVDLQACGGESNAKGVPVTTLMLRNIPNKYTQNTLMKEINALGFASSYDFFYLPMDVHNRSNVGYAFINFLCPAFAEEFRASFSGHEFERFRSRKVATICYAHLQGLDANIHHFQHRAVALARNEQYRPAVFRDQKRIKFQDAVAELLQRIHASTATKKEFFSREMDSAYIGSGVVMPRLHVNVKEPENHISSVDHKWREVRSNDDLGACPAPLHSARRGLEDAILGLLMKNTTSNDQDRPQSHPVTTSSSLTPSSTATSAESARSLRACYDDDGSCGSQCQGDSDDDVMQLLSLRAVLVNRLQESSKGPG